MRFTGKRTRLAGALALAGVITLVFASVAGAQTSPSEYPPPPPSPLAPPDWDFDDDPDKLPPRVGDVDFSGDVDIVDALLIAQYDVQLREFSDDQLAVANVTGTGLPGDAVDIVDALLISQYDVDQTASYGILRQRLWKWPAHANLLDPLEELGLGENSG